ERDGLGRFLRQEDKGKARGVPADRRAGIVRRFDRARRTWRGAGGRLIDGRPISEAARQLFALALGRRARLRQRAERMGGADEAVREAAGAAVDETRNPGADRLLPSP